MCRATAKGALTVTDPDGHALDARVLSSGRTTRFALRGVSLPGVYIVETGGRSGRAFRG